ncbi:MAG: hypothetical protein OEL87_01760, partial [Nanoarchaeota archaeon]|nr:hypothetical protein [Nanoarchaeota archaeon]
EHKSPLGQYRLDAGLKIKDLAKLAKTHNSTIAELQNGSTSPIYENSYKGNMPGSWKPVTLRIAEVLETILKENAELRNSYNKDIPKVTVEDLFPRYACKIDFLKPTQEELASATGRDCDRITQSTEELYEEAEMLSKFKDIIRTSLNERENRLGRMEERMWGILERRFIYGDTLDEVSEKYKISRERASQIEKKALKILRHPTIKHRLTEFL